MALPRPSKLGLALSGGGFRATLFHLGVIRFLFDIQRLHEVRQICSVSGGSIMAAHLVLHWDKYTNYRKPNDFDEAAAEVIRFVKQDVRGNIERRLYLRAVFAVLWAVAGFILITQAYYRTQAYYWIGLPVAGYVAGVWVLLGLAAVWRLARGSRGRTDLLRRHYDVLYRVEVPPAGAGNWFRRAAARVGRLFDPSARPRRISRPAVASDLSRPDAPDLHILATSLTTREMVAFDRDGLICDDESAKPPVRLVRGQVPLSLLVGASSAFPPFFPPVRIDNRVLRCRSDQFKTRHRLTDGGIYDNLGLEEMLVAKGGPYDLVVASDAESPLDLDESSFGSTTGRNFRATYILMERVGKDVRGRARAALPLAECKLSNASVLSNAKAGSGPWLYAAPPALQSDIVPIRTDLDGFSDVEVHLLVSHGYAVAREAWQNKRCGLVTSVEPWSPVPPDAGLDVVTNNGPAIGDKARARWRRIRLHPWNARERTSWLLVALLLGILTLGVLWRLEYTHFSDLASKAGLLTVGDPIRTSSPWFSTWLYDLAEKENNEGLQEKRQEIKVVGTPKAGWVCARPMPPERCRLVVQDGYKFKGFICRFRHKGQGQEVDLIGLRPVDEDNLESFDVPQTSDPDCDIVVVGRLLKSSEGAFPDPPPLDQIIFLETRRDQ